jgi:8-oxo-dGTP pyrophosphatase MutT (NUDIX family)
MRPRDAATLVIIRDGTEVLLGVRNARHVFMPHRYVFPGGRVDAGDARVPAPRSLAPHVEERLLQSVAPPRARALAMAAVRETFEETGLVLGTPVQRPLKSASAHWQPFYAQGVVPALDKLDYFARAITPPGMVRRFDARFFIVDARHMSGRLRGNGELGDLRWVALDETKKLPLAPITDLVLELLAHLLSTPAEQPDESALYRRVMGRELIELHRPTLHGG